jgi:hypothetical protein
MQKVYRISWGWEADFFHILTHERAFSEEEFRRLCERSIRQACESLLRRRRRAWFASIMKEAEEILCKRYGFKRLELVDGWFPYPHTHNYKLLTDAFPFLPERLRRTLVRLERARRGLKRKK